MAPNGIAMRSSSLCLVLMLTQILFLPRSVSSIQKRDGTEVEPPPVEPTTTEELVTEEEIVDKVTEEQVTEEILPETPIPKEE